MRWWQSSKSSSRIFIESGISQQRTSVISSLVRTLPAIKPPSGQGLPTSGTWFPAHCAVRGVCKTTCSPRVVAGLRNTEIFAESFYHALMRLPLPVLASVMKHFSHVTSALGIAQLLKTLKNVDMPGLFMSFLRKKNMPSPLYRSNFKGCSPQANHKNKKDLLNTTSFVHVLRFNITPSHGWPNSLFSLSYL